MSKIPMTGKDVVERLLDKFADQDTIDLRAIGDEVATLIDQAQATLREALRFYADEAHYVVIFQHTAGDLGILETDVGVDKGARARKALTSVDSKEE